MNISDLSLKRASGPALLTAVNAALREADVSAVDRTVATQVLVAEIVGKAAPLPSEGQDPAGFFRETILPQAQTLFSAMVEVMAIDVDLSVKTLYSAWLYRVKLTGGLRNGVFRPDLEQYIAGFDLRTAQVIREYPRLKDQHFYLVDVLTRNSTSPLNR